MKDSLKNNDCFHFANKHNKWLHYQLFSFVFCVVFCYICFFLNSLENLQQRAGHSTSSL
jgi:hypothetical protein